MNFMVFWILWMFGGRVLEEGLLLLIGLIDNIVVRRNDLSWMLMSALGV